MKHQSIVVLGSTGSIGQSTLDVIKRHPEKLSVYALSAYSRMVELARQAYEHSVKVVLVPTDDAAQRFKTAWVYKNNMPEIRVGSHALCATVTDSDVDTVMAAIVGAAGLPSSLAAAQAGKRVLLANKEALVAAGGLFMNAVRQNGAELLPIDSEHNAIFQCLPEGGIAATYSKPANGVRRLLITASGGPFRTTPLNDLVNVTPAQACAHPNWEMGKKISVDSATMINKGLEVIEAHWLFAMPTEKIQVVVHPQSVVHSMVEYEDGSILAQLGQPDMRTPIAHAIGFPKRIDSGVGLMDLALMQNLAFEQPDMQRFPCLQLAFDALDNGQWACIALNAANEVAVEHFLQNKVKFTEIASVIKKTMEYAAGQNGYKLNSLEEILAFDNIARIAANNFCLSG